MSNVTQKQLARKMIKVLHMQWRIDRLEEEMSWMVRKPKDKLPDADNLEQAEHFEIMACIVESADSPSDLWCYLADSPERVHAAICEATKMVKMSERMFDRAFYAAASHGGEGMPGV